MQCDVLDIFQWWVHLHNGNIMNNGIACVFWMRDEVHDFRIGVAFAFGCSGVHGGTNGIGAMRGGEKVPTVEDGGRARPGKVVYHSGER